MTAPECPFHLRHLSAGGRVPDSRSVVHPGGHNALAVLRKRSTGYRTFMALQCGQEPPIGRTPHACRVVEANSHDALAAERRLAGGRLLFGYRRPEESHTNKLLISERPIASGRWSEAEVIRRIFQAGEERQCYGED